MPELRLSDRDRQTTIRLLVDLRVYLKSEIECHVVKGETEPREKWLRAQIRSDRTDLEAITALLKKLRRVRCA